MNSPISTKEIKQQSITGAKWIFITNTLNIPAAFMIAFFLGRISPEALGAFGLIQIFIGVITTFILFGGQTVLRNFMPKVSDPVSKGKVLFTYSLILLAMLMLMLGIFTAFPGLLEFFLRRKTTGGAYVFFLIFSLVVVASELFSSASAGMMNIKISSISQAITRLLPLPIITLLFFTNRPFLKNYAWLFILSIYLISYAIGASINAAYLFKENRFKMKVGMYLPKGFVPFCLTTHLATIFSFLYNDADRIFMLRLNEMGGLGLYQAVLSISQFIDYAPRFLSAALVPLFSSLLAAQNQSALKKAYDMIQHYSVISISIIGLFTISFSRELLTIFGSTYADYNYVLAMFGFTGVICSLFLGNTTLLISNENNIFRLGVSTLQIIIQLSGTFIFINSYGILAVAGFKALGRVIANIINILYIIFFMPFYGKIPRNYLYGIFISGLCFGMRTFFIPQGLLWSGVVFSFSLFLFICLGKVTFKDITEFINIFQKRKMHQVEEG
jgi:O-antigen/teichoic acid export membrane protein